MLSLNCLAKQKERGDFAFNCVFLEGGGGGGMGQGSSGLGKHKNASGPTKSHIRLSIFKAR